MCHHLGVIYFYFVIQLSDFLSHTSQLFNTDKSKSILFKINFCGQASTHTHQTLFIIKKIRKKSDNRITIYIK